MKQININVTQKSNNSKVPKNLGLLPQASGEQSQGRFFVDINGKSYFITLEQLITLAQNGVAILDSTGRVPQNLLPSYVDDVIEYENKSAFPISGEGGKIYIDLETNLSYRWGGTTYVEISPSLALGETDSTAYAGNKGKQNADDIKNLQKNIINVKGWVDDVGKNIENFFIGTGEVAEEFKNNVEKTINNVIKDTTNTANEAKKWVDDVGTGVKNWIDGVGEGVKNWIDGVGEGVTNFGDAIEKTIENTKETLQDTIDNVDEKLDKFFGGVTDTAEDIVEGAENLGQKIGNAIGGLFGRTSTVEEKTDGLSSYITLANQNIPMITYEMNDTIESENTTFEFNFTSNGVQFNKMVFNNNTSGVFTIHYYKADGSFESVYSSLKTGGWFDTAYKFIIASNIPTGFLNYAKIAGDTWVLDNTFGTNTFAFYRKINFVVGNTLYKQMIVHIHQESIDSNFNTYYYTSIEYLPVDGASVTAYYTKNGVGGWQAEEYRTIVVLGATDEDKDNLNKIGSMVQEKLETDAKTIAGALNEVNRKAKRLETKIDEGGGGTADLSAYQTKTDETLETESKEVVGAINEVNALAKGKAVLKLGFYNSADGQFYMSPNYGAPMTGENNTLYVDYNTKKLYYYNGGLGQYIEISPDSEIDTSNLATVDKITYIDTYYTDNSYVSARTDGIVWENKGYIENLDGDTVVDNFTIAERVPIVAGENVTFEVDEENQVVKINANTEGIVQAVIDALPKYDGEVVEI